MQPWLITGLAVLLLSAASNAQQALSDADMQRIMEQAREMQACLANADQAALADLRTQGEQLRAELKSLCAAGKRDEAQHRALAQARVMANSPAVKALAACGEMAKGMLESLPLAATKGDEARLQVCDNEL